MIDSFMGEYRWLSNFGVCQIRYNGRSFSNSEAAYQAEKFTDEFVKNRFIPLDGSKSKKLAKDLEDYTRRDWLLINSRIMSEIIHAKFAQNIDIREKLVLTYPQELVEGNTWNDKYWGVCNGVGQNMLGRILMAERVYWCELTANKDSHLGSISSQPVINF
jgi:ribA/ribD-fused uncharacterized protein